MSDLQDLNQALATMGSLTLPAIEDKSSYKYTKRLMNFQNDLNKENWALQNAYNTPKAQMERFASAGLNPNLIYGQSNTAGDVGNVSTSQFHTKGYDQFINLMANAAMADAQLRQIDADIAFKGVQSDNVKANTQLVEKKQLTEEFNQAIMQTEKLLKEAGLEGLVSDNAIKKLEAENWQDKYDLYKTLQKATKEKLEAETKKTAIDNEYIPKRFNFDAVKFNREMKLRENQFEYEKNFLDPVRYSDQSWRKRMYYDRGIEYHQGSQLAPLFNKLERGVSDMIEGFNNLVKKLSF